MDYRSMVTGVYMRTREAPSNSDTADDSDDNETCSRGDVAPRINKHFPVANIFFSFVIKLNDME